MMPVKNVKRKKRAILVSRKKKLMKAVQLETVLQLMAFKSHSEKKGADCFPFVMARYKIIGLWVM
jgi:hypothetical protein